MNEIPNLVAVQANWVGQQIRFQISTLEQGLIVDVGLSPDLALMAVKILTNALARVGEVPDDQKC